MKQPSTIRKGPDSSNGRELISRARWIWPEAYMYLHNHFAQFRRDLQLRFPGKRALLHITADKSYKLFVNGQYVCRGPARGYQSHWPFDTVDIRPYLKPGHNWISVEAYNPGISTFQYLHLTRAGLLCAPEGKELEAAWKAGGEDGWQFRRSPAHATQTARLSLQTDFQEHVDFAKDDRRWISSGTPPRAWEPRIFDPHIGHNYLGQPFGTPPYVDVEERGIPLMREWLRGPARVIRAARGKCNAGYKSCENVSWFWYDEFVKIAGFDDARTLAHEVTPEALTLRLDPNGPGKFQAVFIDTGDFAAANLIVEVLGAAGGEILDFQYDQTDAERNPKTLKPGEGCLTAMSSRLRLVKGKNLHEFYQLIGFQHLTLIARDVTRPITVKISLRCAGYPFTFKGSFKCPDRLLNDIWEACRRTQQLCSFDAYVDTPWREQAQWWGDARVQARNTFYLDGDPRLLARGIRSIGGQFCQQGLTYGHAPTSSDHCILPDFSLTWILTIWDYYFQSGDISLFSELLPKIERVLGYFQSPEAVGKLGLLQYDPRFWLFEDWSDLPKDKYPCFLNLWYLLTLRHVVKMLRLVKKSERADFYAKRGEHLEKLILRHFLDPKTGLLRPVLDARGIPQGAPSVHDQTLALMLWLLPGSHDTMITKVLLPYLKGAKIAGAQASAFWSFYVLEEMGKRGYGLEALDYIRKEWTPMLSTGTTWEGFTSIRDAGASNCHAWTAHPCVHFTNILCGIRQAAPAWKEIVFAPYFAEEIDSAEAAVPSPAGLIRANWRRRNGIITGELKLPAGVKARVELPGKKAVTRTGTHRFRIGGKVKG